MVKKGLILVVLLVAIASALDAQQPSFAKRIITKVLVDTTASNERSLRVYPTLGYAPETSFEFGLSSLMLFKAKNNDSNRLSELQGFTFITLQKQYGIFIDNAIYGDKDKWFFLGKTKFQRFPLLYYGIGPNTDAGEPAVIDASYLLLRQRVLRKVVPNLFFGPEVDYQLLFNTDFKQPSDKVYPLPEGANGTSNLGLGLALVYDNRHNVLNVRDGLFAELSALDYRPETGSDYRFYAMTLDIRSYHPINKRNVLAWQLFGNRFKGNVPFNQLALIGGDMMMRGYYQGRYRDKNLFSGQVEYRLLPFKFSKRIGGAVFGSLAAVAPRYGAFAMNEIRYAGGAGLRYLLFPKKDIFIRFDVGVTREGLNFYLYTGEAF